MTVFNVRSPVRVSMCHHYNWIAGALSCGVEKLRTHVSGDAPAIVGVCVPGKKTIIPPVDLADWFIVCSIVMSTAFLQAGTIAAPVLCGHMSSSCDQTCGGVLDGLNLPQKAV